MAQAKKKTTNKSKTAKSTKARATKNHARKASSPKKKKASAKAIGNIATAQELLGTMNKTQQETNKTMETIMTQGKTQFDKLAQDATKSSKQQMDAMMKSGNIFMKGFEDITKTYMSWAQSSAEKNSQAMKALLSCKSINEYTETQNKWIQQNFDDFMAGSTKISELGVKVATDAFEPINDQLSKSIKKAAESVAA